MIWIAILGGTSHISKDLIVRFGQDTDCHVTLFNRNAAKATRFIDDSFAKALDRSRIEVRDGFDSFLDGRFDVVINCTGAGTRRSLRGEYWKWFAVTEEFDNLALRYLREINKECLYISFSSGMIYGRPPPAEIGKDSAWPIQPNNITDADYYGIARLNAEAKHRAFADLHIVDVRIFSFFSRYIDLQDNYFLIDAANAIRQKTPLKTARSNMVRDYIHPEDLYSLLRAIIRKRALNTALDAASAKPVDKEALIQWLQNRFDLQIVFSDAWSESPTGAKNRYCPPRGDAEALGCAPRYTSLETVEAEMPLLVNSPLKNPRGRDDECFRAN